MLIVNQEIQIPEEELRLTFSRSPGPGGQNVNKVNSKATLHWPVVASPSLPEAVRARFLEKFANRINKEGEVVLQSSRSRDAPVNAQDCKNRLLAMLQEATHKPKRRVPTRRTRGSQVRRLDSKRQKSQKKQNRRPPKID